MLRTNRATVRVNLEGKFPVLLKKAGCIYETCSVGNGPSNENQVAFTINLCIDIKAQHCNIKALGQLNYIQEAKPCMLKTCLS